MIFIIIILADNVKQTASIRHVEMLLFDHKAFLAGLMDMAKRLLD